MLRNITPFLRSVRCVAPKVAPTSHSTRMYSLYEPDYLDSLKPKYPTYETLNFKVKGYDFPVLESYQKYLHSIAEYLDLEVSDSWAVPPKQVTVQKFKPQSAVIDAEYKLTEYVRVLQIEDMQAPFYPMLLRLAQAALPEGVSLEVSEHTDDDDEVRYVPDRDLLELKQQLDDLGGPIASKKK